MARITTETSDPVNYGLGGVAPGPTASPEAASAVGRAQQEFGKAVTGLGVASGDLVEYYEKKINKSDAANAVAKFDFSADYLGMQTQAPARPQDFGVAVGNAYDTKVDKYLDTLPNNAVRDQVRKELMKRREGFVSNANSFAFKSNIDAATRDANEGINTQANRVRADGSIGTFDDAVTKTNKVIDDNVSIPADLKGKMKEHSGQQLADMRFQGMISASMLDPVALDGIHKELTDENSPWKGKLSPQAYDRNLDKITTLMKAANTQEVSAARSALQSVHERNINGVEIDPTELQAVQSTVVKSGRPELMSQLAMLQKMQQIYRDNKGLPLDQMRGKIQEAMKQRGVEGLDPKVREGINQGSALTNGEIGPEYLAGLANAEYGQLMKTGDFTKGTQNKTSDGRPGSDAVGIAQFTGSTFLSTVRKHAYELGVDGAMSDAAILEKRKDPTFSLQAAALHALDNKRTMEASLGRPLTDGDLYFAHFLGTAGGINFLRAADATPNAKADTVVAKDQVDANRGVFYDEAGRPRTLSQVRSYISNAMMNGVSRVDYAGVKALTKVYENTSKGLKDDPLTFAATTGRFGDIGNLTSPEGIQRRGVVAQQVSEFYKIPIDNFKPLTKDEVEDLAKKARDGTAEEALSVMSTTAALGVPAVVKAANKQIGEKDSLYGYAAGMANSMPDQRGVAADIIRGEKRLKSDKDVKLQLGMTDVDISTAFDKVVGKAVIGTAQGSQIRQAAMAYYAEHQLARGSAEPGKFDSSLFQDAIHAVLGGGGNPDGKAIGDINGAPMLLPAGMSKDQFDGALKNMTGNDYSSLSKWGGPPRYSDGKVIGAEEIARSGRFEALGNGEYRIKMADDKYALSAAYKDGSADFYIFRGDPKALQQFAQRQSVIVKPATIVDKIAAPEEGR